MKTIEVEDSLYEALLEISKEMQTQDNRCTASPYYACIQTKEKNYRQDCDGEVIVYHTDDYDSEFDFDELKQYCEDRDIEIPEDLDWDDHYDVNDFISENTTLIQGSYDWKYKTQNVFFTTKACENHIKQNHYHYNDPRSYIEYAFRNPEMELIQKFLLSLYKPTT